MAQNNFIISNNYQKQLSVTIPNNK